MRIGTSFCNVTSLSLSQLTCKPPKTAPKAIGADGRPTDEDPPEVVVSDATDRWQMMRRGLDDGYGFASLCCLFVYQIPLCCFSPTVISTAEPWSLKCQ